MSTTSSTGEPGVVAILSLLKNIFNDPNHSDLTIKCDDQVFDVHCILVCPRLAFVAAAVNAEHGFKEAKDRVVSLRDTWGGHRVVEAILRYLYTSKYEVPDSDHALVFYIHTCAMTRYLQMEGDELTELAKKEFITDTAVNWDTPDFADAIALLYDDDEIDTALGEHAADYREAVVAATVRHALDLLDPEMGLHTKFREVARDVPAFMFEVSVRLADLRTDEALAREEDNDTCSYWCEGCLRDIAFRNCDLILMSANHPWCPNCGKEMFDVHWR